MVAFGVTVTTGAWDVSATSVEALETITGPVALPFRMSITHVSGPSVVKSFAQVRVTVSTNPAETVKLPPSVLSVKSEADSDAPDVSRMTQ